MSTRLHAPETLERRRIAVFLGTAFGIAWLTALAIYLTGGLADSPELAAGVTLATVLMAVPMMFAPGVANVVTRVATGEGWGTLRLRPETDGTWKLYAVAWLAPAVLTLLGAGVYFLVFPGQFDPSMTAFADQVERVTGTRPDVTMLFAVQLLSAVTIGPVINALFAFGEEFGWRGYLLPKLMPLGARKAVLLHGLVWGVWHWPVILMGYEYGFDYPGFPVSGLLVFLVFTVSTGTFLAWLTVREGSVWPAAIGHGAVNAVAGISALVIQGEPNPLLGPLPVGLVGALPFVALAAYLLLRSPALADGDVPESPDPAETSA